MESGALMEEQSRDLDFLLAGLTEAQRSAVVHTEGPLLILAAAGSGKTRVITRRIAYLLAMGVPPWQVMALTFTNKAAGEMRERARELLSHESFGGTPGNPPERLVRGLTVTTFHALCARLLRKYAPTMEGKPRWGIRHDYSIYDSDDQAALVKRIINDLGMSTSNWPPRSVLSAISGAKNKMLDAEAFERTAAHDFNAKGIAKVFHAYEKALRAANAVDFDDLLLMTVRMLKESEEARSEVQARWRYLMIDEYQDTNTAQFVLSTLLVGRDSPDAQPNVAVVGDPDQSIYGWRGADISNILDFEDTYPGARVIPLGQNFRSRAPILAAADQLIRNNKRRKHKDLFTKTPGGEKPQVILCRDEHHEAGLVVDWLKQMVGEGKKQETQGARQAAPTHASSLVPHAFPSWKDAAILYRNNSLSRVMEDALRTAGIPYVIARGTAFYQREEVKDALAYLRVVANPADDVSLRRIVNKPARKIGPAAIERLDGVAVSSGVPLITAMRAADQVPDLGAMAINAVAKFAAMLDSWSGSGSFMGADVPTSLSDLVSRVVKESGLEAHYKKAGEKNEEDAEKLSNLEELVSSAAEFEREYDAGSDPAYADDAGIGRDQNAESTEESQGDDEQAGAVDFLRDLESDGVVAPSDGETGVGFVPPLLGMLRAYLESVSLVADADKVDPARGAVTLMTLHAAKGLEFHAVAIIGLEEGLLPSQRAMESDLSVEEERRLMFVGITRAMEHLLITCSKYRTQRGLQERTIPSRFLNELPKDQVIISDQSESWNDADDFGSGGAVYGRSRSGGGAAAAYTARREPAAEPVRGVDRTDVPFPVGSTVRHPQFGVGKVESITGMGVNTRARIAFRDVGPKTLVLQYARLERVK